jgi:hypothetical protein
MHTSLHLDRRPEAMADVPGVCELPLTRAVVQYRDVHEVDVPGGRIRDIGLALVLEGRYASTAEVVDLGSADVKLLDLSGELVVLDWVYEPTLDHVAGLVAAAARGRDQGELARFGFRLALAVLERVGFGPLTRPTLLRLGFRDVCSDLDLNDGTSVRIAMDGSRIVRAHMDYDGNALLVRTPTARPDSSLEGALADAFPGTDLRRLVPVSAAAAGGYQVRFPLPLSLDELRTELAAIRAGLVRLLARFEPTRFAAVEGMLETFGERETLARIREHGRHADVVRVAGSTPAGTVH